MLLVFAGVLTAVIISFIAWLSAENVILAVRLLRKERYQEKLKHLKTQRKIRKARKADEKQKEKEQKAIQAKEAELGKGLNPPSPSP